MLLVSLATEKTPEVTAAAEQLYATLLKAGVEVLYDDREAVSYTHLDVYKRQMMPWSST